MIIKCENCGKEFNRFPYKIKEGARKYCSRKCRAEGMTTPNIIEIFDNHAEIIMESPKYGQNRALIDIEDIDKVKQYRWAFVNQAKNCCYAYHIKMGFIHRLILNPPKNMMVDHINHNGLDNRKSNLRICSNAENQQNQLLKQENKSGCKCVYFNNKTNKYEVKVTRGRKIYLGSYSTFDEAENIYIEYITNEKGGE